MPRDLSTMEIREIRGEQYNIEYRPEPNIVSFQGSLRLGGTAEYAPIAALLNDIVGYGPPTITLNLTQLKFLNSSGISMLSKFVINVRKQNITQVVVVGSNAIPWQGKSLKNLQRLLPGLRLDLE